MYGMGMGQPAPYIDSNTGQWVIPPVSIPQVQNTPQVASQAPQDGLIRVTGIQGAKLYQMPANSRTALFDDTDDIVIIKSTDGAGFATYRRARLDWLPDEPEGDTVTRAELNAKFEELKGLILNNGKQSIRKPSKGGDTGDGE